MSVRAIAVRNDPRLIPSPGAVRRGLRPGDRLRERSRRHQHGVGQRLADDRRLIGVKMIVLGLLALATMALEVPW